MQTERMIAIDPERSVLVQAPAGSGKTTLLTQRFLRLLAVTSAPENILALTFTRKAAQEMRARVIAALHAAAAAERPPSVDERTFEFARIAARALAARGIDLIGNPARLRIETIDGFFSWLAAQLPVTAGAGGRFSIAADPQRLYEEAARRALSNESDSAFAAAIDHALELNDERWGKVHEIVAGMLRSRESWLPVLAGHLQAAGEIGPEDERTIRQALDEDLTVLIDRQLQRAADSLGAERLSTLSELLGAAADRLDVNSETLRSWRSRKTRLQPKTEDVARWRELAGVVLTEKDTPRKTVNVKQGFGTDCDAASKSRIKDLLEEFATLETATVAFSAVKKLPDGRYDDAHWNRVKAISRLLVLAAAQLDRVFTEAGECDFPAVAMAGMRALGTPDSPTDLALALDYRIEHLLVDEFQDTSNAQLDLFKSITAGWQPGDGRTFFCVGDPMQSIYGFREAEVRAFLELSHAGLNDLPLTTARLRSNFRAQSVLVDWVNATFSAVFPRQDDRERGAIAYSPAEAKTATIAAPEAGVTTLLFADAGQEATRIAQVIEARLAQHPHWRVAVLVRTKKLAAPIAAALRARQLPFRAAEINRLQDQAVVSDIVMLARALLHGSDRTAWLAVLRSPFVGLELADLWQLTHGAPTIRESLADPEVRGRLSTAGQRRAARIDATLVSIADVRDQSGFSRWVERAWIALGGAAAGLSELDLRRARAAFDRLRELDAQGLPDPSRLEQAFDRLFASDEGEQAVEIMTIHKSKGLEFDLVIVPRLESAGRSAASELLQQHRFSRAERPGIVLAARAATGDAADPLFEFLRWAEKDATRLEAERLLYVACTRAKQELWLTGVEQRRSRAQDAEFTPVAGSLLRVLWPTRRQHFMLSDLPADAATKLPARPVMSRLNVEWTPDLNELHDPAEPERSVLRTTVSPIPPFDWASEAARQIGILVHEQLQNLQLNDDVAKTITDHLGSFERWFEARGLPSSQIKGAARRVLDALLAISQDERGRWILAGGYQGDARELALSSLVDGRIVKVILDRMFVHEGVRWVIDYKTSEHAGGDREAFLDNEVGRYAAQMQRYAVIAARLGPEPVRLGLYFPLMRAWREWAAPPSL